MKQIVTKWKASTWEEHSRRKRNVSKQLPENRWTQIPHQYTLSYTFPAAGIVSGICSDVPAWAGRETEGKEKMAYFSIQTADRIIKFECRNKEDKKMWVEGVQSMLRVNMRWFRVKIMWWKTNISRFPKTNVISFASENKMMKEDTLKWWWPAMFENKSSIASKANLNKWDIS